MAQTRARAKARPLRPEESKRLEAVARVTGAIAHDMNNLLMLVQGYADLLLARTPADDARRADAESVMAASRRATAFTDQLLTIGRRRRSKPETFEVNAFLAERREALERELGAGVRLEYRLAATPFPIRFDRSQMEFVLLELARNARSAMPEGGALTVSTARTGGRVELEFRDTGAGIDPELRERLFEPFATTKPKGVAKGLGLATVWAMVAQAGGEVALASQPGRGAVFSIRLPEP